MIAAPPAARKLTEAHRLHQARLGAQLVADVLATFGTLNVDDLDTTSPAWLRLNIAIVAATRRQSARTSANYYRGFRGLVIGSDGFTPTLAEEVDRRRLSTALLVTGVYRLKSAIGRGTDPTRALEKAKVAAAGAAMRLALEGGRDTLTAAVNDDARASGYQRVTSGETCTFCSGLAREGAVSAAHGAKFTAHDHCKCSAEPIFQ